MAKIKQFSKETKFFGWWKQTIDYFDSWRNEAIIDRYYYENKQWTASEVAELQAEEQPVITVNHIFPKVNMLVGLLLQTKPTIRCLPRGKNDAEIAAVGTKIVRYIFDINSIYPKETEAFTDMATTGLGWLECRGTSVLGKDPIVVDYIPCFEVMYDPLSRQPDFSDSRFIWRGKWVDTDLFLEFFPNAKGLIKDARMGTLSTQMPGADDREWFDRNRERVFLVELQYKKFEKTECYWDGLELVKYIPSIHEKSIYLNLGRVIEAKIPVVYQAFILGDFIIYHDRLPYLHSNFTLIPFIAHRDLSGNPVGVVRYLRDMQDEVNKRRSKVLHYLTSKRVLAEKGAVPNPNEFMEELSHPKAFLTYNKGYSVEIQDDLHLGQQHFQLMQQASSEMSTISGINPDFQGVPTNARTGNAIRQRVMQSQLATQKYFSAMERGLKQLGETCIYLAKQYYTDERVIQLTDEPYAVVLNEPVRNQDGSIDVRNSVAKLRADIIVRVEAGGQTERQQELVQLIEVLKVLPPETLVGVMDVVIDAFDIPQKAVIKERFAMLMQAMQRQAAQQGQPAGQPPPQGQQKPA